MQHNNFFSTEGLFFMCRPPCNIKQSLPSDRLRNFLLCWIAFCLLPAVALIAQEAAPTSTETSENAAPQLQELKRDFIGITLGQTPEEFRQQLSRKEPRQTDKALPDSYYYFLYDLYSSEIEERGRQETLVEVKGNGFVDKGVFQFAVYGKVAEARLIAITIFLNTRWSSYDQMFQKLRNDYGNPNELSPQKVLWQNEETIVSLEKQLRYKIVDRSYLEALHAEEQQELDFYQYRYEEFLKKI